MPGYGGGEKGLLRGGTGKFGVVKEPFCLTCGGSCIVAFVKTRSTMHLKSINFTVYKLYLKMGSKRPSGRGFCFQENVCSHPCLRSANLYLKKI